MSYATTSQSIAPRGLRRTVAPTFLAVDKELVKLHCRIDGSDEDPLLVEYIEAALAYAEFYQQRCLRTSTWQAVYDGFPCGDWYLPMPRLQSVSSIVYTDLDSTSQTLSTSIYTVDAVSEPGRIALQYGQVYPPTLSQIGAVTVTFVAGYTSADGIPARTRQAIRILAGHWFRLRTPIVIGASVQEVPLSVKDLLDADKFVSYR